MRYLSEYIQAPQADHANKSYQPYSKLESGFTLLEMVLVLFLMGMLASATLFLTENVEDQAKYDETKRRMDIIRKAIVGDPTRTINGSPEISGFVADMGRLPKCVRELLEQTDCGGTPLTTWSQDTDSGVWSGWRGPYIQVSPETSGALRFRDGYGNEADAASDSENSGWKFNESLGYVSLASDGIDSSAVTDDITNNQLVVPTDYQVQLGSDWQNISVTFSTNTSNKVIESDSLRVRLNLPEDGLILGYGDAELDSTAERDLSFYLTETFPSVDTLIPVSGNISVSNTESLALSPNGTLAGNNLTLTAGTLVTYTNTSAETSQFTIGDSCTPDCVITVPAHSEADGVTSSVTFTADGSLGISPFYVSSQKLVASGFTESIITAPLGSSVSADILTLPFGATVALPAGSGALINNKVVLNGDTVTVSEAFNLTDTSVTTVVSGDSFIVPQGTTNPSGNDLLLPATSIVPIGIRSLTVICESDGSIFNGDCTATEEHEPVNITITPRGTLPLNSSTIDWSIE